MRDPRCWREVYIRGGMTLIISAVAYFMLDAGLWIWLFPLAVVGLVLAKWAVRPQRPMMAMCRKQSDILRNFEPLFHWRIIWIPCTN
jgi:hypothetical protein